MALISCRECGSKISKKAAVCPSCGVPRKAKSSISTGCGCLIIAGVTLAVMAAVSSRPGRSRPQREQTSPRVNPTDNESKSFAAQDDGSTASERHHQAQPMVSSVPVIPGLRPADVYLNLTNKGFSKTGPRTMPDGDALWKVEQNLDSHSLQAEVWAPGSSNVRLVRAFAVNSMLPESATHQIAKPFFGYLATLPYDGSTPIEARRWVETHAGTNASKTFGKVEFELFATSPRAWGLRLTAVK